LTPVTDQNSVDQAAEGAREESIRSQQTAEFYCPGFSDLRKGVYIQIEGVSEKDAGIWRIFKNKHRISNTGYSCSPVTLDRENIGLREGENIESVPESNLNRQEAAEDEDVIINAQTGESIVP
jgi:hypothetical protein